MNSKLRILLLLAVSALTRVSSLDATKANHVISGPNEEAVKRSFTILEDEFFHGKSIDYRVDAGLALLPYDSERVSRELIKTLQGGRAGAQLTDIAVDSLSRYLSPPLLRAARRTLKLDPTARWAIRLLSFVADPRDIPRMERYFLSPIADPEMIPLLTAYGKEAVPLLERLMHRSFNESCRAALILSELGDTSHYNEMEDYGSNNLCLAWTFAQLEPLRAKPLMLSHINSSNPNDREKAVYALGFIEDTAYLPLLYDLLSDTDRIVASNAAFSLGFFADTSAAHVLRDAVMDTTGAVGKNTEQLLIKLPEPLFSPVLYPLLSQNLGLPTLRAVKAAGALRDSGSLPYLFDLLEENDEKLERATIDALGDIGIQEAREEIVPFLDSESVTLKVGAMIALGKFKDTSMVARLNLMLFWEPGPYNEMYWIRHPIVDALVDIGDTAALPALAVVLEDPVDLLLAGKIVNFFAHVAPEDYIPYLEPLLDSPSLPLRLRAASAILAMTER